MLWSLIKIVLFIAAIALLTLGAEQLMQTSGGVRVAVGNIEFNLGPLQAVIALLLLAAVIWLGLKLIGLLVATLKFVSGDETALSRWWSRSRERKGFEALAEGLMALASGESRAAMAKAQKAERYLKRPELTNLITAQAAEMAGDTRKAEQVYKRLLQDDRTRFVGVRGIMKQKLLEGDTDTAMRLAEKAFALKPRHEETQDVLLRLQADKGDWAGARKTLGAKLKYGHLPRDVHRRRDAVLALGEAKSIVEEGKSIEAREAAILANKLSPDLVPAAVMAARGYVEQGQKRYATRVISKAWTVRPHPDLAAAFAGIEPDEKPLDRLRRFQALTKQHQGDPESKMLRAELFIAAERYGDARGAMGDLAEKDPTARSLTIMAAIERGEGAPDREVKAWLARAVSASRGPQWVCDNCHNIPGSWTPACPNCGAFDSLSWRVPSQQVEAAAGATAGVLPLIVGEPEPVMEEAQEEIEDAETEAPEPEEVLEEIAPEETEILEPERTGPANHDAPPPAAEAVDAEIMEAAERARK